MNHEAEHHWSDIFGDSPELKAIDEWLRSRQIHDWLYVLVSAIVPGYSVATAKDEQERYTEEGKLSPFDRYLMQIGANWHDQGRRLSELMEFVVLSQVRHLLQTTIRLYNDQNVTDPIEFKPFCDHLCHILDTLRESGHLFEAGSELSRTISDLNSVKSGLRRLWKYGGDDRKLISNIKRIVLSINQQVNSSQVSFAPSLELLDLETKDQELGLRVYMNPLEGKIVFVISKAGENDSSIEQIKIPLAWHHFCHDADVFEEIRVVSSMTPTTVTKYLEQYQEHSAQQYNPHLEEPPNEVTPASTDLLKTSSYSLFVVKEAIRNLLYQVILSNYESLGFKYRVRNREVLFTGPIPSWMSAVLYGLEE